LIAFSINNWNSNRIEKKKEANYIENLNREFQLNREQLDIVILGHQKVYINTTKIINLMPIDSKIVNKDSLSLYIAKQIIIILLLGSEELKIMNYHLAQTELIGVHQLRQSSYSDRPVDNTNYSPPK